MPLKLKEILVSKVADTVGISAEKIQNAVSEELYKKYTRKLSRASWFTMGKLKTAVDRDSYTTSAD